MNAVMLGVIAYILVQFAIGAWVSKRIATQTDFLIAGRRLGLGLVSFSVFASFFGAEAIVGTAGSVYESGLSGGRADPFGYALAMIIMGTVFAAALWRRSLVTFADFFRQRFSPRVEWLVVLVLLPGSIFWAAAQIRAFGQVVSATSGINVTLAMMLALFAVVAYSVLGGLLADAWTDFVQGLAIVLGLVLLSVVVAGQLGGLSASLAKVPADRWAPLSLGEGGIIKFFDGLAIPICGSIVAVELVSRVLGARTAAIGARGAVYGGVLYFLVGLLPVYLGLVGPELIKTVDESEQIVPKLAEAHLNKFLYVLFAGAIIAAILSTVDTVLLAGAGQVSHNVLDRVRPVADEAARLARTRIVLVVLAIVALAFALGAKSVRSLVETASSAGSAGVFVVLCFGLFSRLGGSAAATAAIVTGVAAWLLFGTIMELTGGYMLSVALSALVYLAVAKVFERDVKPVSAGA